MAELRETGMRRSCSIWFWRADARAFLDGLDDGAFLGEAGCIRMR